MEINKEKCIECGKCARVCPHGAITGDSKSKCNRWRRRVWKLVVVIIVLALLFCGLKAKAQVATPNDSAFKEQTISEVVIKAHMPTHKTVKGGTLTRIAGSVLAKTGTAKNVILHLPNIQKKIDGSFEVVGKGTPIVYVNNRKLRDLSELDYIKSNDIQNVEVITSPSAEYDASVGAVIRIKTLKNQGDGVGVNVVSSADYAHRWNTAQQVGVNWQAGKLETFAMMRYDFTHQYETGVTDIHTFTKEDMLQNATSIDNGTTHNVFGKMGFNYDFNSKHSIGAIYELTSQPHTKMRNYNHTDVFLDNNAYDAIDTYASSWEKTYPTHHVSGYYAGQLGKLSLNVDADVLLGHKRGSENVDERSTAIENYFGSTSQRSKNRLYAGKLTLAYPVWKGNLSFGSEYTYTRRWSASDGYEGIIQANDDKIKDRNMGVFMGYEGNFGPVMANIGMRYEHVVYDFFEGGIKSCEKSKTYDNFFPTISLNSTIGSTHVGLDYHIRTFRPFYMMLESNTHYNNRYSYISGSPDLQPTYIHAAELSAMHKDLRVAVGFNHYKDDILIGMESLESDPKIQEIKFSNLKSRNELTCSFSYAPVFGFWKPEWMVAANTQWLKMPHHGESKNMNGTVCRISWGNAFQLPSDFLLRIDGNWNSNGYEQNQKLSSAASVNASLNKDFCQGRWNLLLEFNDIFHSMRDKVNAYYSQSEMYRCTKDNTWQVKLTVSYNLNAKKSKYKGTGAGNEEIMRL